MYVKLIEIKILLLYWCINWNIIRGIDLIPQMYYGYFNYIFSARISNSQLKRMFLLVIYATKYLHILFSWNFAVDSCIIAYISFLS